MFTYATNHQHANLKGEDASFKEIKSSFKIVHFKP